MKLEKIEEYSRMGKNPYRVSFFKSEILPQLCFCGLDITERENGSYTWVSKLGTVDFYPKSNRLLIRPLNRWKSNGIKYIEQELI